MDIVYRQSRSRLVQWPTVPSGPDDDARKTLGLPLGTLVAASDFVTWRLLADTIATWELP